MSIAVTTLVLYIVLLTVSLPLGPHVSLRCPEALILSPNAAANVAMITIYTTFTSSLSFRVEYLYVRLRFFVRASINRLYLSNEDVVCFLVGTNRNENRIVFQFLILSDNSRCTFVVFHIASCFSDDRQDLDW
jgi:hypothetical protein